MFRAAPRLGAGQERRCETHEDDAYGREPGPVVDHAPREGDGEQRDEREGPRAEQPRAVHEGSSQVRTLCPNRIPPL